MPESPATATVIDIVSFDVTGTGSPSLGPVAIDASENGGTFHVHWRISANGSVHVEVSIGESGSIFGTETLEFFDRICNADSTCLTTFDLSCTFQLDHRVTCVDGKGTNLATFLDSMPKQARLHLSATGDGTGAGTAMSVEFRD